MQGPSGTLRRGDFYGDVHFYTVWVNSLYQIIKFYSILSAVRSSFGYSLAILKRKGLFAVYTTHKRKMTYA